jgi:hypothetical protein
MTGFYVLNASDAPIYGTVDGARVDPARYAEISADLHHIVENARGRDMYHESNMHSRLPGRPPNPVSMVRTSEKAIHATELTSVGGRLAVASVMRMAPLTARVEQAAGAQPLLVSIRILDADFLQELSKRNLIDSPRFSPASDKASDEHAWPVTSDHNELIGYFIWKPELPGTTLMHALAPITGASIGVMMLFDGIAGVLAASFDACAARDDHGVAGQ